MAEGMLSLDLTFRIKANELIRICLQEGVTIHPYCWMRTCQEQARLYRQSRSGKEVNQKAQSMRDRGYTYLADILLSVGPQPGELGRHVTFAGPGESWHQFGKAMDCVPLDGGKLLWNDSAPQWKVYGRVAEILGLEWAGAWNTFSETPHVQERAAASSPLSIYSPAQAESVLRAIGSL